MVLVGALGLGACGDAGSGPRQDAAVADPVVTEAAAEDLVARGKAVATEFECVRCHSVPGLEPGPAARNCVGCHQRIESGAYDAEPEVLARWQDHVEHLTLTPDLGGAVRLRREWIANFLLAPHDVRPGLEATMPRLAISEEQAAALAAFLSPGAERAVSLDGDVARGRSLVRSRGCESCHSLAGFGHTPAPVETVLGDAARLAPALQQARDRMRPDTLLAWLRDPRQIHANSLMPAQVLTEAEARDVSAFLLRAPLTTSPPVDVPARLPVLDRPVSFAEVNARVFKRTCWHCHSDPAFAPGGDGGPGNTGGLGFAGRGLDLSSHAAISAGSRDDEGERRSIFRRREDGTPALVAHLDARRHEQAGRPVDGVRGMPLGLPALGLEDLQLVESWIAQGRPR